MTDVTEVNVTVPAVNVSQLSEGDMRNMFSQLVDTVMDHSKLSKRVAELTEQFNQAREQWSAQASDLHRQIDEMRQSLVAANAERDTMRSERDEALNDARQWHDTADRLSENVRSRNQTIMDLEQKVREFENTNKADIERIRWLEGENANARTELDRRADRIHELESTVSEVRASLDKVFANVRAFAQSA